MNYVSSDFSYNLKQAVGVRLRPYYLETKGRHGRSVAQ